MQEPPQACEWLRPWLLGFSIGSLPFTYLGVSIFKGKPRSIYFQLVVDKVKLKHATWKHLSCL